MSESKETKNAMSEQSKPMIPHPKVLPKPAIKRLRAQDVRSTDPSGQMPKASS